MRQTAFALFVGVLVAVSQTAGACTIFMAEGDGIVLAGNNEDFYLDVHARMWVTPGTKNDHGRVCFGFDDKVFAQGGVNDQGLFFDAAVTPKGPEPRDRSKPAPPKNMGDRLLAECATVEDAISWLGRYRLTLLTGSHLLLADKSGDAAVVELVDGEMTVIRKDTGKRALGVTNFSVTKPEMGNFPCPRFLKMRDAVKAGPATLDGFKAILKSVGVPKTYSEKDKRYGGTLYSNVYDLTNGVIQVYNRYDFDHVAVVDVAKYLNKGKKQSYDLDDLFGSYDTREQFPQKQ